MDMGIKHLLLFDMPEPDEVEADEPEEGISVPAHNRKSRTEKLSLTILHE